MTRSDIQRVFADTFNGQPNILTPDRIDFGKKGKLIWELSRGEDFPGTGAKYMYGVTVLTVDGERNRRTAGLSQGGFTTEAEAREYIASLTLTDSHNMRLH